MTSTTTTAARMGRVAFILLFRLLLRMIVRGRLHKTCFHWSWQPCTCMPSMRSRHA